MGARRTRGEVGQRLSQPLSGLSGRIRSLQRGTETMSTAQTLDDATITVVVGAQTRVTNEGAHTAATSTERGSASVTVRYAGSTTVAATRDSTDSATNDWSYEALERWQ